MNRVLVFAGTTEGREIALFLAQNGIETTVCVATEYGETVIPQTDGLTVQTGRLEACEMQDIIKDYTLVIDATHPYAIIVTQNIKNACCNAGVDYIRLLRPRQQAGDVLYAENAKKAAEILDNTEGNVLLTTGSKELEAFTTIRDFEQRLFIRALPTKDAVEKCEKLNIKSSHIILMQGPFSHELNLATLRQINAKYIVTKESGSAGGFAEKLTAAKEAGVKVIVISRPPDEIGIVYDELKVLLLNRFLINREPADEVKTGNTYFPLFVNLQNKKVLIFGAGNIATRRIRTLLRFGAQITVIAPQISEQIEKLREQGSITVNQRVYQGGDVKEAAIIIAATNSRETNHAITEQAKKNGIPVSVADKREESSFYFPALFEGGGITGGLISQNGGNHSLAKEQSGRIRQFLSEN